MKNERTSKRVASIAGKVLRMLQNSAFSLREECWGTRDDSLSFGELKALAASCLTQTPDKKKKS